MAKLLVHCPHCKKPAEILTEKRNDAWGVIFKTYTCGHTVTEKILAAPETSEADNFDPRTKDYQKDGIRFLEQANFNAALTDEAGLGKTIQYLEAIRRNRDKLTPVLFTVKSSLKLQLLDEMWNKKWLCDSTDPRDIPLVIFEGKQIFMPGMRYYIIAHSMIDKFKDQIKAMNFQLIIVDESQHFMNTTSKRTKALLEVAERIPHRICTSGNAILNRASEYWPTLNLIKPDHWPYFASFLRNWIDTQTTESGAVKYTGIKPWRRDQFFERTRPYILRRKKRDVLKDLPPFTRHFKIVDISETAVVNKYNQERANLDHYMNSKEYYADSGFARARTMLGYLMRMRHLCGVAKSALCVEEAIDFLESTRNEEPNGPEPKLLIGCHHDDVFANLAYGLKNYNPVLLPSSLDNVGRQQRIEEFKRPERRVGIAKILAQGEGLNLQFIQNLFVLERMWNAGKEEQFEGRIDRFGQTAPTVADYFIAKNTVDEVFSGMVEEKRVICGETLNEEFDIESDPSLLNLLAEKVIRQGKL